MKRKRRRRKERKRRKIRRGRCSYLSMCRLSRKVLSRELWPTMVDLDIGKQFNIFHHSARQIFKQVKINFKLRRRKKRKSKQVSVGTTMRPVCRRRRKWWWLGGGQYWWSPWGFRMSYLLISSEIRRWKRTGYRRTEGPTDGQTDRRTDRWTDGPTDTPSYRDAKTHLKSERKENKKKIMEKKSEIEEKQKRESRNHASVESPRQLLIRKEESSL